MQHLCQKSSWVGIQGISVDNLLLQCIAYVAQYFGACKKLLLSGHLRMSRLACLYKDRFIEDVQQAYTFMLEQLLYIAVVPCFFLLLMHASLHMPAALHYAAACDQPVSASNCTSRFSLLMLHSD